MASPAPVDSDDQVVTKRKGAEVLAAAVCASVMNVLGRPDNLFRVSAVRLWGNKFRVNVQTGPDAASVLIPHSFFVVADEKGNVVQSIPAIARRY